MSRTARTTIAALGTLDLLLFFLTIRAHRDFHRTQNGPAVMTIGQLLGWIVSVTVLLIIVLVIRSARLAALARRRARHMPHAEPDAPRPISPGQRHPRRPTRLDS